MIRNRLLAALIGISVSFIAASAAAQVQRVPGSGCPGAPYPTTAGAPAIGQGFGIVAAPCRTAGGTPFIILGAPGPALTIPAPPACARGCVLACRPIVILPQQAFRLIIPRDRNLVGARLCAQTGCIEMLQPPCIYLHGALDIRITP